MKQVYLVTAGEYSDFHIEAAYSTYEAAAEAIDLLDPGYDGQKTAQIIEFDVQDSARLFTVVHASVYRDGRVAYPRVEARIDPAKAGPAGVFPWGAAASANTHEQALKIAQDALAHERADAAGVT